MRVCIIGKFPPIQGGVSMRTYWTAHGLALRGHQVHVVTNAKEVISPFRMRMRAEDWERCNGSYAYGSVAVHWTDPVDRSQSYIPMASPFVSKLAAIAGHVHSHRPFDVILSHYLEPYGVAGHLAAQMTGVPHVVRMAGSDAGRLWRHPQFETLYDHVLRSAEIVVAAGVVAERAIKRGVDPDRVAFGGGFAVPDDLFVPDGPVLDLAALRDEVASDREMRNLLWGEFAGDRPYFGVCGKLGESKGSFALLAAMHRLKCAGVEVGLVALAHGHPACERSFRARARKLGLVDRVLQIPFLPHWRVPEFLRSCIAVCCLEQDFPIGFHTPMIPREVLLCGACLVGSTEVIRKLPAYARLPHGYGCVAIKDVDDVGALSGRLAAIVQDPQPAASVRARGRAFARELQTDVAFPQVLERILEAAAERRKAPAIAASDREQAESAEDFFPFTRLAAIALNEPDQNGAVGNAAIPPPGAIDLGRARQVLAAVERGIADGRTNLKPLAMAVETEMRVAAAENDTDAANPDDPPDPLFRLHISRWAMDESDLPALVPVRDPRLRVIEFDYDVSEFRSTRSAAGFPAAPRSGPSYIVAFARSGETRREPVMVDGLTARILQLSDGTRTAWQIVAELRRETGASGDVANLRWIESLFLHGMVSLREQAREVDVRVWRDPANSAAASTLRA